MIFTVVVLAFAILFTSTTAVVNFNKSRAVEDDATDVTKSAKAKKPAKVKKPGQVKGLKKVKVKTYFEKTRNVSSAKITFKKVKGATGYQILIYDKKVKGCQTPLLYEKTTKKTTYTIKNLIPGLTYTIKVRAYTKGKNGKPVYGKYKSIKVKMPGKVKGLYYVCNHCVAVMPSLEDCLVEHTNSVRKVHGELHSSGTYNWK